MRPVKVMHVATGLGMGGAETMLYRLLSGTDPASFQSEVVSLVEVGPVGPMIQALGVPVRSLGMRRGMPSPAAVLRLARWVRAAAPDVIQTWMYHADLVGGLAAKLAGGPPVAWGIHHTTFDPRLTKKLTIWTAQTCARLSRWLPARIVCCSEASRRVHIQAGYAAEKIVVIPNGFDLGRFMPDPAARRDVRREIGIPEEAPLVGLIARFDPQKDHRNFLLAAARLHAHAPESHFLLCGDGVTPGNRELAGWIEAAGVGGYCHLLGRREDTARLMAALDVATTSSAFGEAFPIVVGEAMACGVPCVVTDVGDSAVIVGETGAVVPPGDPDALAAGWRRLLDMRQDERSRLGMAARQRIGERYSLKKIVAQYEQLYRSMN